jgi:hypothetical protein
MGEFRQILKKKKRFYLFSKVILAVSKVRHLPPLRYDHGFISAVEPKSILYFYTFLLVQMAEQRYALRRMKKFSMLLNYKYSKIINYGRLYKNIYWTERYQCTYVLIRWTPQIRLYSPQVLNSVEVGIPQVYKRLKSIALWLRKNKRATVPHLCLISH